MVFDRVGAVVPTTGVTIIFKVREATNERT